MSRKPRATVFTSPEDDADIIDLECSAEAAKETSTGRQEKTFYLLADAKLLKLKMEVAARQGLGRYESVKCRLLEIDGDLLPPEDQERAEEFFEPENAPSTEEQLEIVKKLLARFEIRGNPVMVSEEYARGHIRLMSLRRKLFDKDKGGGV